MDIADALQRWLALYKIIAAKLIIAIEERRPFVRSRDLFPRQLGRMTLTFPSRHGLVSQAGGLSTSRPPLARGWLGEGGYLWSLGATTDYVEAFPAGGRIGLKGLFELKEGELASFLEGQRVRQPNDGPGLYGPSSLRKMNAAGREQQPPTVLAC